MALTGGGLLVAIFMPGALALRPQLLVVPLFLGSLWVLRERHRRPRLLGWLPVIGAVWANVHGSFLLLGLLATIAATADIVARRPIAVWTALAAAGSLVVALANPWGVGIYRYVATIASSTIVTKVIDEWQPLWRQWPAGLAFLVALVAAITLVLVRFRRARTSRKRSVCWPSPRSPCGAAATCCGGACTSRPCLDAWYGRAHLESPSVRR